jgi:mono/diheme cytochrome c family protein
VSDEHVVARSSISRGPSARTVLVAALSSLCLLLIGFALAGCNEREVQTWSPGDHDHAQKGGQVSGTAAPGQEQASLVAVTWRQTCAPCHGMGGRGDGPTGRMMKVADLTGVDFGSRSDEEIAKIIREGRNQMPAFSALPPAVVEGLVKHVRSLGRR